MTSTSQFKPYILPIKIAIASRLVLFLSAVFFPVLLTLYGPFYQHLAQHDAAWYQRIASGGYQLLGQGNTELVAFFPFFPLLTRFLPFNFFLSAYIINNLFFIATIPLFFAYMRLVGLSHYALTATILLAFSPFSFYFSVPYTESIFVFLTLYLLYFAEKGEWYKALLLAPFISATRNIGVFIVFPLGLIALKQFGFRHIFTFARQTIGAWLTIFAVPLGLFCYMAYLYRYTGDAFAFKNVQSEWGRLPLLEGIKSLIPNLINQPSLKEIYHAFFFFLALLASFYLGRLKYYYQALWLLVIALLGAITGTFTSMARFVMAGSPFIYMALALIIGKTTWLQKNRTIIYLLFATMFGFFIAMWMSAARLV